MFVVFPPDVWYMIAAKLRLRDVGRLLQTCKWLWDLGKRPEFWAVRADARLPGGHDARAYNAIRTHGSELAMEPALAYRYAIFWKGMPHHAVLQLSPCVPTKRDAIAMYGDDKANQHIWRETVQTIVAAGPASHATWNIDISLDGGYDRPVLASMLHPDTNAWMVIVPMTKEMYNSAKIWNAGITLCWSPPFGARADDPTILQFSEGVWKFSMQERVNNVVSLYSGHVPSEQVLLALERAAVRKVAAISNSSSSSSSSSSINDFA